MRIVGALLLGLGIGVTCRFVGIPLPSSPALVVQRLLLRSRCGYAVLAEWEMNEMLAKILIEPCNASPGSGGPHSTQLNHPEDTPMLIDAHGHMFSSLFRLEMGAGVTSLRTASPQRFGANKRGDVPCQF
jgi:XapX domain-containing protein